MFQEKDILFSLTRFRYRFEKKKFYSNTGHYKYLKTILNHARTLITVQSYLVKSNEGDASGPAIAAKSFFFCF